MNYSKKKVAILSNIATDLLVSKLSRKYDFYVPDGFDAWVQDVISSGSKLYNEALDAVVLLLDGTEARKWKDREEGADRVYFWKQAVNSLLNNISSIPIFITTIDIRENRIKSLSERKFALELANDWYMFVQQKVEESSNVYVIDLADSIYDLGRDNFYSNKLWYMSSMPYSRIGLNRVSLDISRALDSAFLSRKKVLALDLDNTLWGGVIGEDGIDGVELSEHKEGQRYYDFQRQLVEMKNRGILLAINSKNNESDTENIINNHSSMILRDNDFVCKKINWNNKASNLKLMEKELNITEGGFIFIDDNPVERETVKGECSECFVPDFPIDTTELIPFAENIWFDYCRPLRVLGEDLNKTKMYQNESKRKIEQSLSLNLDDYIKKLQINIDIHKMKPNEVDRVVQLINKTNQFNVTTKRYSLAELSEIANNRMNTIYVVHSSDKYGDYGLISVVILKRLDNIVKIDSFLMSCRVMGRNIEFVIFNEIFSMENQIIRAEFIPTPKNAPVKNLFDKLGFKLIGDNNGHKTYEVSTGDYVYKNFDSYNEIKFEA